MKNVYKWIMSSTVGAFLTVNVAAQNNSFTKSDVEFWIGEGPDSVTVVIDYVDSTQVSSFAWGVAFEDSITGNEILDYLMWYDIAVEVDKGAFLSAIEYKKFQSNKPGFFWATWEGTSFQDLFMNAGLSDKVGDDQLFGFSYTDFEPAIKPSIPVAAIQGKFSPQVGKEGTDAIASDSSVIEYVMTPVEIDRGLKNIAEPDSGDVSFGDMINAGVKGELVSLGDRGTITLELKGRTIIDGPGADFAVFENAFQFGEDQFLELAFVEVSEDGERFVRFPARSITPAFSQKKTFDPLKAEDIHNLAGKYLQGWGTPFDLAELPEIVSNVNYVRLIDVVGSIDSKFRSIDSKGNIINDPYPTAFESGGFDLDFVGVINSDVTSGINGLEESKLVSVYPTVASDEIKIETNEVIISAQVINTATGVIVFEENDNSMTKIDVSNLNNGIYVLRTVLQDQIIINAFIKQ